MKHFFKKLGKSPKGFLALQIITSIGYLISLIFFTKSVLSLQGIETAIRIIILAVLAILWIVYLIFSFYLLFSKKWVKFLFFTLVVIIFTIVASLGSYFIDDIYSRIAGINKTDFIYTSSLVTLKDKELADVNNIGMISDTKDVEGNVLAKKLIEKESLTQEIKYYDDYTDMIAALYSEQIDALFISGNYLIIYKNSEIFENIEEETKVLLSYSEKMDKIDSGSSNKSLTEPFTILLLGVDGTGDGLKANASFNGDTLMLITFNPNTMNVTMFSIPRDTYVPIACRNNASAKINSSAAYGTNCVIETIEQLTDIPIDYYVKINFRGVVDLVDALGGVTINSPIDFCEQNSNREFGNKMICLKAGEQEVNGEEALAFARHRKSYANADISRIQNQQHLVERMMDKAKTIRSYGDFQNILTAIENNIDTNMTTEKILSFYDVGKDLLFNMLNNGNEAITIERTYLEWYSLPVYIPSMGMYTSALGYYDASLQEIITAMKVNLELEEPEHIKTFSFGYNEQYETKIIGKGATDNTSKKETMTSFIGQYKGNAQSWCTSKGKNCTFETASEGSQYFNKDAISGTIVGQSRHTGELLSSFNNVTFYLNDNPNYGKDNSNQGNDNPPVDDNEDTEDATETPNLD